MHPLTKKKLAGFTIFMFAASFVLLFVFLPSHVVEPRMQYSIWFFSVKIAFLSIVIAAVCSFALIIVFRWGFVKSQLATFNKFKHLLRLLVKRDFSARYRKSVLGVLWSLLNPLLTMLIMTMVFSFIFARNIPNFPVYLLSGQLIFMFFSESTNRAMASIIENAPIIKKVYIPKYIFPLARVLSSLVNLFFSLCAFTLVFIVTRAPFHLSLLLIPIPIIYTFIFALGVGLLLSSLSVFFRDLTYLYGVSITLLTYLTPIFYPIDILPGWVQNIVGLNPIYHFVDYFRCLALYGTVPDLWSNIVCIGFAAASLSTGLYVVMKQQDKYILYI